MPNTYEEYSAHTKENTKITGIGLGNVYTEYPCPFCAAPAWAKAELMETAKVMSQEHTCSECGRSAKCIFHNTDSGASTTMEMVQTGGDDQPDYFTQKMRRIDDSTPGTDSPG